MAKEQERHGRIMTIEQICIFIEHSCELAVRIAKLHQEGRDDRTLDYWIGFLNGVEYALQDMLAYTSNLNDYHIQRFESQEEAEKYAYDEKFTATEFDAALSALYRDSGIAKEELEVGKNYSISILPYGCLKVNGETYAVYDDDAGQSDYIRINGENFSAGSYNFFPEEEFIAMILHQKIVTAKAEIVEIYKGE